METNKCARDVRTRLKSLNVAVQGAPEREKSGAQYKITVNMHATLTKKFLDLMTEYQEIQTKYKTKTKEKVERQYLIGKQKEAVFISVIFFC